MKHLDRETLERFYDSDLKDEGVEHVLAHLTACETCEDLAEEIWSQMEPRLPGSGARPSLPKISQDRRDSVREATLKELRFGHLLKDVIEFFTLGLGRLVHVFLMPLERALDDSSKTDDRRKPR